MPSPAIRFMRVPSSAGGRRLLGSRRLTGVEPDKSAALGAAALQVWARAVEATKSLDRKTVAEAIRGKTIKGTVFGDATFLPNGQLQPRYVVFKVVDGKTAKLEPLPQN